MEYCGGGSIADLMNVTEEALEEYQIAYICREALKVSTIVFSLKMKISIFTDVVSKKKKNSNQCNIKLFRIFLNHM